MLLHGFHHDDPQSPFEFIVDFEVLGPTEKKPHSSSGEKNNCESLIGLLLCAWLLCLLAGLWIIVLTVLSLVKSIKIK